MSMDAVTEKIAHFVGAFAMIEQQARLRTDYDTFRAMKAAEDEAKFADLHSPHVKHSFDLDDFDPKLNLKPIPAELAKGKAELSKSTSENDVIVDNSPLIPAISPAVATSSATATVPTQPTDTDPVNYVVPPPSAMAGVTIQWSQLADNDVFGQVIDSGFEAIAPLVEALQTVYAAVSDLSPIKIDLLPTSGNWYQAVQDIRIAATQIVTTTDGPLQTSVHLGADASGIYVNGTLAAELPDFTDLLPAYIADKQAALQAPQETVAAHDFGRDFDGAGNTASQDTGLQVVAGANSLINTASITSNWLDAEVIAVAGNVVRFDAISQVNVLIDHDQVTPALRPVDLAAQDSTVINAAAIAASTVAQGRAAAGRTEDTVTAPKVLAGAPANWAVVHYDGPVTQINWVEQYTFTTDNDQAVVSFGGTSTFLGLGENGVFNDFSISELGYQYDLILVGGNLIDINLINQTNILLDSDRIDETFPVTDDQSAEASLSVDGGASSGVELAAADVSGVQATSHPVAASAKDAEAGASTAQTTHPFSTGDNLLYNQASIERIGLDTDAAITQSFADALDQFGAGNEEVSDDLLGEELFDGTELLRVLYIDGDFLTVNVVDQVNVLGDADQVHLARDDFAAALQDQIKVTTGSNVLANVAAIKKNGLDSTVMAQGETYSDALIHQANLIDTDIDTMPAASSLADLATEAVAFLVDDAVPSNLGGDIADNTHSMIADAMGQSDLMQTMLA